MLNPSRSFPFPLRSSSLPLRSELVHLLNSNELDLSMALETWRVLSTPMAWVCLSQMSYPVNNNSWSFVWLSLQIITTFGTWSPGKGAKNWIIMSSNIYLNLRPPIAHNSSTHLAFSQSRRSVHRSRLGPRVVGKFIISEKVNGQQ